MSLLMVHGSGHACTFLYYYYYYYKLQQDFETLSMCSTDPAQLSSRLSRVTDPAFIAGGLRPPALQKKQQS